MNVTKGFGSYCVSSILMLNMNSLFYWNKKQILTLLKKIDKSNRKPNKIWVDKGSEFCNRSMKSWLLHNDIEIYLTHK